MKRIKVQILQRERFYVIHFDRTKEFRFTNLKKAQSFKVSYERVLTLNVNQLNAFNSSLYQLYRHYFFQIPHSQTMLIDRLFVDFLERFDYVFHDFSKGNGFFVFSNLDYCYGLMFEVLNALKSFSQSYKQVSLAYTVDSCLKDLEFKHKQYNIDKSSVFVGGKPQSKVINIKNPIYASS